MTAKKVIRKKRAQAEGEAEEKTRPIGEEAAEHALRDERKA